MRNIKTGKIAEHRFRSGETLEFVRVERHPYQYLYDDGQMLHFMDQNTYEQIPVEREKIGDEFKFLKENGEVQIAFEGDEVLSVELPMHVNLLITHSEPGVRGDTATNVTKPATLESGAVINVPIFINEGDVVRVDTRTGDYIERVKD